MGEANATCFHQESYKHLDEYSSFLTLLHFFTVCSQANKLAGPAPDEALCGCSSRKQYKSKRPEPFKGFGTFEQRYSKLNQSGSNVNSRLPTTPLLRHNAKVVAQMNLLVTGGAGFIGSHLCERLLHAGHAVCVLDDLNPFYDVAIKQRNLRDLQALGKPFSFCRGDVTDPACLRELLAGVHFDQIIHLAARAGVRPSLAEPALYQRVNVEGTAQLLEAARRHGVQKIIIASSSSVYGLNARVPFVESDPIFSPVSPYAASKLACEALGHVFHHLYGMDIVLLRFFTVYGPRQRPDLAIHKFTRLMDAGEPVPVFGDGLSARDYTFVTDTVDGIMACTEREFGFQIINLGEAQTVTLNYLVTLLEQALGKKAVIHRQPPQPGDVPLTCADISKAKDLLAYQPKIKIEEGIPRFIDWYRNARA